MKKVFLLMAAAMMVMTVACNNKPSNKPAGGNEEEDEVLIKIDGQFADWNALTDIKVAKHNPLYEGEVIESSGEKLLFDGMNNLKAVADQFYLYLYFEVDMSLQHPEDLDWQGEVREAAYAGPVEIYIDADNNGETGAANWLWDPCGTEYNIELPALCSIDVTDPEADPLKDSASYEFTGEDGEEWWGDVFNGKIINQLGLVAAKGARDGDILKYEVRVARTFLNKLGKKAAVCVEVLSENWALMGHLPQPSGDGGYSGAPLYVVDLP